MFNIAPKSEPIVASRMEYEKKKKKISIFTRNQNIRYRFGKIYMKCTLNLDEIVTIFFMYEKCLLDVNQLKILCRYCQNILLTNM